MVVEKAVKMARLMNIPVLGLVENMRLHPAPRLRQSCSPWREPAGVRPPSA